MIFEFLHFLQIKLAILNLPVRDFCSDSVSPANAPVIASGYAL